MISGVLWLVLDHFMCLLVKDFQYFLRVLDNNHKLIRTVSYLVYSSCTSFGFLKYTLNLQKDKQLKENNRHFDNATTPTQF